VRTVVGSRRVGRVDEVVDVRVRSVQSVQLAAASAVVLTLSDVDTSWTAGKGKDVSVA
jgi:hypothetical protein